MDTVSREIKQKNGLTYWLLFLILEEPYEYTTLCLQQIYYCILLYIILLLLLGIILLNLFYYYYFYSITTTGDADSDPNRSESFSWDPNFPLNLEHGKKCSSVHVLLAIFSRNLLFIYLLFLERRIYLTFEEKSRIQILVTEFPKKRDQFNIDCSYTIIN